LTIGHAQECPESTKVSLTVTLGLDLHPGVLQFVETLSRCVYAAWKQCSHLDIGMFVGSDLKLKRCMKGYFVISDWVFIFPVNHEGSFIFFVILRDS
jgi:hypothetical protein